MPRSIRPFTVSQAEPRTPLSIAPYRSRDPIHFFNEDADEKNYKYVAFRPGYAVQAAELNEIQSYMAKENTLFATMVSEWGYYVGKPYVGSGDEESSLRYGGPGWDGACPLHPYGPGNLPGFDVIPPQARTDLVNNQTPISVTNTGSAVTIQFNQGYYLSSVRTGTEVDNGMKYWVYLNYGSLGEGAFTISVPYAASGITYIGLFMTQSYYTAEEQDGFQTDTTLRDNSAGFYNQNANGAARVAFNFTGAASVGVNGTVTGLGNIAPVLYIDHSENKLRYMNNLILEEL